MTSYQQREATANPNNDPAKIAARFTPGQSRMPVAGFPRDVVATSGCGTCRGQNPNGCIHCGS